MKTIYLRWYMVGVTTIVVCVLLLAIHVHLSNDNLQTSNVEFRRAIGRLDVPHSTKMKCPEVVSHSDKEIKYSGSEAEKVKIEEKLIQLAKAVSKAKTHVRGTKTGDALRDAVASLSDLMKVFDLDYKSVTKRKIDPPKSICPEVYNGTTFGYPFFYKGFEKTTCSYGKEEHELLTVLTITNDVNHLRKVLRDFKQNDARLSVIVGLLSDSKETPTILKEFQTVSISLFDLSTTKGVIWNNLLQNVKTEYAVIARDITTFNEDARLSRLVREMERLGLVVAGGAVRDPNGFWKLGCQQRAYKNSTISYLEGYDESLHECIFCDHIDGPFVIRTKDAIEIKFDNSLNNSGLFEDFFMRVPGESAVCADSMFYVNNAEKSKNINDWSKFASKYSLWKLLFSSGTELLFPCRNSYDCFVGTGYAVTPCCLKELADMVNFVMKSCEEKGIICELQEGTLLGAVKLHKVLPWERDADLTFLTANYSVFQSLDSSLKKAGYSYSDGASLWCCVDNRTAGGKFKVGSAHWHIELYGQHLMDSEMLIQDNIKPSKVPFDGRWVNAPRNPGWHARNRYGHEIYAHSQHWLSTGKSSGWINYETNTFTKCYHPGSHNCLDRFNADGNLAFGDPIP